MRTSGLLLAALALTRLLRRATAATRHLVWHSAVIAVVLAPAMILVAPRFELTVPGWFSASLAVPAVEQAPPAFGVAAPCEAAMSGGCLPRESESTPFASTRSRHWRAQGPGFSAAGFFWDGWLAAGKRRERPTRPWNGRMMPDASPHALVSVECPRFARRDEQAAPESPASIGR